MVSLRSYCSGKEKKNPFATGSNESLSSLMDKINNFKDSPVYFFFFSQKHFIMPVFFFHSAMGFRSCTIMKHFSGKWDIIKADAFKETCVPIGAHHIKLLYKIAN